MDNKTSQFVQKAKQAGYSNQEIQQYLSQKQPESQTTWLNTVLPMIGGGLGAVGGGALGAAGGALIPGADLTGVPEVAGGYLGATAGAGVGAGAGNQLANFLDQLVMGKKLSTQQQIQGDIDNAKIGAASEAVGLPIAKGLGVVAHPIKPFIDMVDKELSKSPDVVDFGKLMNDFEDNRLPQLQQKYGSKATDAWNSLETNTIDMIKGFQKHNPNMINDLKLPISQANQLKRNLYELAGTYGHDTGKADKEGIKSFGNTLKEDIHVKNPVAQLADKVASIEYKVPQYLNDLGQSGGLFKGVEKLAGLPIKTAQKVIPAKGGYLNQAVPRLMQLLGFNSQSGN